MKVISSVNKIFSSVTYILCNEHSSDIWLVDVGDMDEVMKLLPENSTIKGAFITHSHFDHIYGLNDLIKLFPDCVVFVSADGRDGLYSAKKNFSYYHETPFVFEGTKVVVLNNGDVVEIFDKIAVKAIYTPGHDSSCITYQCMDFLFTGDSYIPGAPPVTKLKGGNKEEYVKSIERILKILECTQVCPGHRIY